MKEKKGEKRGGTARERQMNEGMKKGDTALWS